MNKSIRNALIVIAISNLLVVFGFDIWQSTFNNFAVEELGAQANQIGLIQAIREIPGLLGLLVGVLALVLAEMRIASISIIVMGVGIFVSAGTHSLNGLIAATLLMSVGFHFFYSGNSSAVLLTVGPEETPKMLGRLNSLGALAAVLGALFVFVTLEAWGLHSLLRMIGVMVTVGGGLLLPFMRQPVRAQRSRRRMPLRRRYWLYYLLQFLMGSRRHIFTTFAVFLLVKDYGATTQLITLLYLLNNLIGTYMHQALGKIVARFGERAVLTVNFVLLTVIFVGYAVVPLLPGLAAPIIQLTGLRIGEWVLIPPFPATPGLLILLALFVVDHVLFGFSIAVESYFQKIAVARDEITPNVSLGQTINHIAAVVIPVVGGVVWETLGAQYTFLTGVVIVLLSLWAVRYVRPLPPEPVPTLAVVRQGEPSRAD